MFDHLTLAQIKEIFKDVPPPRRAGETKRYPLNLNPNDPFALDESRPDPHFQIPIVTLRAIEFSRCLGHYHGRLFWAVELGSLDIILP